MDYPDRRLPTNWDQVHKLIPGDRDVAPISLYRGVKIPLDHPATAEIRRAVNGQNLEGAYGDIGQSLRPPLPGMPGYHQVGGSKLHPHEVGQLILDHLHNYTKQHDLGRHWSIDPDTAESFAHAGHQSYLPIWMRAHWTGAGEDTDRTGTYGDWDESEITMVPGAKLHLQELHYQDPATRSWVSALPSPQHRTAADWSQPKHLHTPLHTPESRPSFYHPTEYTERHHFSPTEFNPAANSPARPKTRWRQTAPEQPTLDLDTPTHFEPGTPSAMAEAMAGFSKKHDLDGSSQLPTDRAPQQLFRTVALDLNHPDLQSVHRALYGRDSAGVAYGYDGPGEGLFPASRVPVQGDPRGFDNPELGQTILDHLENNRDEHGLGRHWSTDPFVTEQFVGPSSGPYVAARITGEWLGRGEDPYRTDTGGNYSHEQEITLMPGAPVRVTNLKLRHPQTGEWHSVFDGTPQHRTARWDDEDDEYYEGYQQEVHPFPHMHTPKFPDHASRPTFYDQGLGRVVQHFAPNEMNPASDGVSRPSPNWKKQPVTHPQLDLDYAPPRYDRANRTPTEIHYTPLYRGVNLDLNHPDLHRLRRVLYGDQYEDAHDHQRAVKPKGILNGEMYLDPGLHNKALTRNQPWGWDGQLPDDAHQLLLDHVNAEYGGLGTHWTDDIGQAQSFASQGHSLGPRRGLPVVLHQFWRGVGEDPYRRDTDGEWTDEREITQLRGAPVRVHRIDVKHSPSLDQYPQWRTVYRGAPLHHQAAR